VYWRIHEFFTSYFRTTPRCSVCCGSYFPTCYLTVGGLDKCTGGFTIYSLCTFFHDQVCRPSGAIFFLATSSAPYIANSHCMVVAGCHLFSFFIFGAPYLGVIESVLKSVQFRGHLATTDYCLFPFPHLILGCIPKCTVSPRVYGSECQL
jgi:hypothetical protein